MIFNDPKNSGTVPPESKLKNRGEIAMAAAVAFCDCTGVPINDPTVNALASTLQESFKLITATAHAMSHLSNEDKDFVVFCAGITSGAGLAGQAKMMSTIVEVFTKAKQAKEAREKNENKNGGN